jgi:hypothetical protein
VYTIGTNEEESAQIVNAGRILEHTETGQTGEAGQKKGRDNRPAPG